jgi:hypothetical protein
MVALALIAMGDQHGFFAATMPLPKRENRLY